ncbi:MAG: hypothetical protein WC998_05660 [Candidatus Paceibacterota bacterium]|jgi:uncharacterized BrkB/YihY/UPF0761 family membrane protein
MKTFYKLLTGLYFIVILVSAIIIAQKAIAKTGSIIEGIVIGTLAITIGVIVCLIIMIGIMFINFYVNPKPLKQKTKEV